MRTLKVLTHKDERLATKLIREKKSSDYILFYHSEWDSWSQQALARAEAWAEQEGDEVCYVISSWELPHVFSAFGITSAPCVVEVKRGDIKVFIEYPKIYDYFTTTDQTPESQALPQ